MVGVEVVFGDDFAGGVVDDEGVCARDEEQHLGARVCAADAEVAESPGPPQGDFPGGVDVVVADPPVAL